MSDLLKRIEERIHDAPMPTERLLDEASEEIRRLAGLVERSAWQPYETAPRDGTPILAYWAPAALGYPYAVDIACWLDGNWCNPDDTEQHYGEPDQWHPLPSPPAAVQSELDSILFSSTVQQK